MSLQYLDISIARQHYNNIKKATRYRALFPYHIGAHKMKSLLENSLFHGDEAPTNQSSSKEKPHAVVASKSVSFLGASANSVKAAAEVADAARQAANAKPNAVIPNKTSSFLEAFARSAKAEEASRQQSKVSDKASTPAEAPTARAKL